MIMALRRRSCCFISLAQTSLYRSNLQICIMTSHSDYDTDDEEWISTQKRFYSSRFLPVWKKTANAASRHVLSTTARTNSATNDCDCCSGKDSFVPSDILMSTPEILPTASTRSASEGSAAITFYRDNNDNYNNKENESNKDEEPFDDSIAYSDDGSVSTIVADFDRISIAPAELEENLEKATFKENTDPDASDQFEIEKDHQCRLSVSGLSDISSSDCSMVRHKVIKHDKELYHDSCRSQTSSSLDEMGTNEYVSSDDERKPAAKRSTTRSRTVLSKQKYFNLSADGSSSDSEEEWDGDLNSAAANTFVEDLRDSEDDETHDPGEYKSYVQESILDEDDVVSNGSSVEQLIEKMDVLPVDTLDDSDASFSDSDSMNQAKYSRKQSEQWQQKDLSFLKERDGLSAEFFDRFDRHVFGGKLTMGRVNVVWSNRLSTTGGHCTMKQTIPTPARTTTERRATVTLSGKVLTSRERLQNTLLHEMCHAAAWMIDGVAKPPHGECFWKWANLAMCKLPGTQVTTKHDYDIGYQYAWLCQTNSCGKVFERATRTIDVTKHCCSKCKGKLVQIDPATMKVVQVREKKPPNA
jgi:predicted SprT family Zn-dependent metalloprotease